MADAEIARRIDEEQRLVFDSFDNERALELGLELLKAARSRGVAVTIDIRRGEQQLFHYAMAGTSPNNDEWVRRKAAVVSRFHKSSYRTGLEAKVEAPGEGFEERQRLNPADFAAHGGSFPLTIRGTGVVGAITVSGLPQREDHELVVETLERYLADAG